MKKNLPIIAVTFFAIASNANAQSPYQYNQYNNYEPASGYAQSAAAASAWPYWYLGLNAGVAMTSSDDWNQTGASGAFELDSALATSATIGYQPDSLRYEIELGIASQDIGESSTNTGDIDTTKLMGNIIYDFGPGAYYPFIGAGLGAVKADVNSSNNASINGSDTKFAYQLIGGLNLGTVLPQTDLSVAYKYLDTFSDFKEDGTEFEYNAHTIEAGAKFRF